MTRGLRLEPKFDISYTVRDLTLDTAPLVDHIFGKAMLEVKNQIRLKDPTAAIETAIEMAKRDPTLKEIEDAIRHKAMQDTNGNVPAAAKLVGKSPRDMYRWIKEKGKEAIQK